MNNRIKIGFFGTPQYAVTVLEKMVEANIEIAFVVTMPDMPKGRKMIITAPPAKEWAIKNNIPVYQPDTLRNGNIEDELKKHNCDVFVVMAYGKIIPDSILKIPKYESLNIHPSLLPKLRGSSPIESAILNDEKENGVTIIKMDAEMDHGPIVAQMKVEIENWPVRADILGNILVNQGADLLIEVLPKWIRNEIVATEQDHSKATFTKKIKKEDGEIDLNNDPYQNFLKIQAYHDWPSAFFFENGKRMKITQASFKNGELRIEKVIPEGKSEVNYQKK